MLVLPIRHVSEEDSLYIGPELTNLAKLRHFDIPVADGVIVIPPEIKLKTVLEHFAYKDKEIFEQKLEIIKSEILKIQPPEELETELSKRNIQTKALWHHLLEFWLNQIRSRVWREGFTKDLTHNLSARPIFFCQQIKSSGDAFLRDDQLVVEIDQGDITAKEREELESYVRLANKKLFLPFSYQWIIEKKLQLVGLKSYSPSEPVAKETVPFTSFEDQTIFPNPLKVQKTTLKLFSTSFDFTGSEHLDGFIFSSEQIKDYDEKLLKLLTIAQSSTVNQVIFKLSDEVESRGGLRGSLRLLHQKKLLEEDIQALTFIRDKKQLLNVHLAVPFVRSVGEFMKLKSEIGKLGINRKSTLKFWMEVAVPENLINLEDYLKEGMDGVLINLDELIGWFGGFESKDPETIFYQTEVTGLIKLLEEELKLLHKLKIPVIFTGSLSLQDDLLHLAIEKGVWGVATDFVNLLNNKKQIQAIEKRIIHNRLNS